MSQTIAIPKRFRPFAADKGPWLIWSMHWNCWHRRNDKGGASGYTNDILEAGIFDLGTARSYHDAGPRKHRRDVSIPAAKALKAMEHSVAVKQVECDQYAVRVARVRDMLAAHEAPLRAATASPARVNGQVPGMTNSQGPTHDQ